MVAAVSPALSLVTLVGGFLLLTVGAEFLLRGSVRIAHRFGLSDLVIGATLVALGTSAPELFVSVAAALEGHPAIALGNVVGSNVCNTLLVMGCAALFVPFVIKKRAHAPQAWANLLVTALVLALAAWGLDLVRWEGLALLALLLLWIIWSVRRGRSEAPRLDAAKGKLALGLAAVFVLLGLVVLWLGSRLTVSGGRSLALWIGLEERVVAITVIALGTSLPELVTSVVAALRRSSDIALGNILGSNIFNMLCILGAAATAAPLRISREAVLDLALVGVVAVLALVGVLALKRIGRWLGVGALVLYVGYMCWLVGSGKV